MPPGYHLVPGVTIALHLFNMLLLYVSGGVNLVAPLVFGAPRFRITWSSGYFWLMVWIPGIGWVCVCMIMWRLARGAVARSRVDVSFATP